MYSYTHAKGAGWIGEFERAADCLISARAMYGEETPIYVAKMKGGNYSDLFIGADQMLSYMREDAALNDNDIDTNCFDHLTPADITRLHTYMVDLIGEWESELPEAARFTGMWVERMRLYSAGHEVRPGHFPP
jgi:hypothetical protein